MSEEAKGQTVKETMLIVGVLALAVAGVVGAYWMDARQDVTLDTTAAVAAEVSKPAASVLAPKGPEALHDDVYFDVKSTRLRADAVRMLQQRAGVLTAGDDWMVLVQGYADSRGRAAYNRLLAQQRAESVKQFLVELGVPEATIKVVTIGSEGALCDDQSKECQQFNRRVHLEMRRLAQRAAAMPDATPTATTIQTR